MTFKTHVSYFEKVIKTQKTIKDCEKHTFMQQLKIIKKSEKNTFKKPIANMQSYLEDVTAMA